MSGTLAEALSNFETAADALGSALGIDETTLQAFDIGIKTAEGASKGEEVATALIGAALVVGVIAAIGPEALAAGVAVAVGEEAVAGAAFLVDQYVAFAIPEAAELISGEEIVASAGSILAGVVVGPIFGQPAGQIAEAINEYADKAFDAAAQLFSSPNLISINQQQDSQVNTSNETAVIVGQDIGNENSSNSNITTFNVDKNTETASSSTEITVESLNDQSQKIYTDNLGNKTTFTYDSPYGEGNIIKEDVENTDGTSDITEYNSDGSYTTTSYSAPDGGGTATRIDTENSDGTSQITTFDQDGMPITQKYSGPNGTGELAGRVINVESGQHVELTSNQPGDVANFFGNNGSLTVDSSGNLDLTTYTKVGLSNSIAFGENDELYEKINDSGIIENQDGTIEEIFTSDVSCFVEGSLIKIHGGKISVQNLRIGDLVVTGSGKIKSIKWVGHRRVDCCHHLKPLDVWPIRIQAGAFKAGIPAHDLFLSPDHAVFVSGVLIPIKHLINGTTIVQERRDAVTYWHVELEHHDVLLAEGLPCESYLDNGNRSAFSNNGKIMQLRPAFSPAERCEATSEAKACAPLQIMGKVVERVRARLRRQAIKLKYASVIVPRRSRGQAKSSPASIDRAALVQRAWYLTNNQDVAAAGVDPQLHYEAHGRQEGRLPCPETGLIQALGLVDPATVIRTMPDVVASGINVAEHFCGCGWKEGRRPNAYFDIAWYQQTYAVPIGMNPLIHYVLFGEEQGLAPSLHFDPAWYRRRYGLAPSVCALAHYLQHRRTQQFSPLPSFDVAAHVQANQATLRPNRDPYLHFLFSEQFVSASERRVAA